MNTIELTSDDGVRHCLDFRDIVSIVFAKVGCITIDQIILRAKLSDGRLFQTNEDTDSYRPFIAFIESHTRQFSARFFEIMDAMPEGREAVVFEAAEDGLNWQIARAPAYPVRVRYTRTRTSFFRESSETHERQFGSLLEIVTELGWVCTFGDPHQYVVDFNHQLWDFKGRVDESHRVIGVYYGFKPKGKVVE